MTFFKAPVGADNEGLKTSYSISVALNIARKIAYHGWRDHTTSNQGCGWKCFEDLQAILKYLPLSLLQQQYN